MLRVLTLSTLYPNAHQPTLGLFVEHQTRGLAARENVEVEVFAPLALPPAWPLFGRHYRALHALPEEEDWRNVVTHRPRFTSVPFARRIAAKSVCQAVWSVFNWDLWLGEPLPKFDVIDAEFFWPDGVAAMHLAKALGVPLSIKARGSDIYYWGDRPGIREQILEAAHAAHGLLAVSDSLKAEMVARGMPADKIKVHHTGVDLDLYRPVDRTHAKTALGVGGPLLATVGALIERKGQSFALDALARLPGSTLLVIGDGPDRAALERRAERLGISGRVRFLGARPPEEVAQLVAAADVMLLPTRAEGIANVWVEALACGTPVVTCDAGGAREVIDTPAAGRVVVRDAEALAEGVRQVLTHAPEPEVVRRSAERFSWERNAEELEAHLRSLLPSSLREGSGEGMSKTPKQPL
ncbi:MAG: glycosyltransferase [Allosphingosinicella sp.]|uniref:glycosyltransferase n=1 Tax=Allosphingosinicella sp. TaxID=2823234 RepID=UPI003937D534